MDFGRWLVLGVAWMCAGAGPAALAQTTSTFTKITWSDAASQLYPVMEAQGKVVNGKLYQFGGFDSQKTSWTPTKRAYVYDPLANTWTRIADLPHTPNGATFGGITNGGVTSDGVDLYIAGGYTSGVTGTGQIFGTKQVWKYVVATNTYVRMPDLPVAIAAGQLEFLDGRLHYVGGTNQARTLDLGTHYVLDLGSPGAGWTASAPMPNPRQRGGSAVFGGKLYYIGGQHKHDSASITQKDVHVFDPATSAWTKVADLPVPAGSSGRGHISHGVAVLGDIVVVFGGETSHNVATNMVSAYAPASNTWRNLTPLPAARHSGVVGLLGGQFFYAGGSLSARTFKGAPDSKVLSFNPASLSATAPSGGASQTLSAQLVASSGSPSVSFSLAAPAPWLTLPPPQLGALSFGLNPAGLAAGAHTATLTASAAGYTSASLPIELSVVGAPAQNAIRINAGGPAFVTADARRFEADTYFAGTDRVFSIASGEILNTVDDALYRNERSSSGFSYRIPVANGQLSVVLHFCEIWHGAPGGGPGGAGKRLFHVDVEGVRKLSNYDIFVQAGGAMRARQESFTVTVTDGMLDIAFIRGPADMPEVSAIEILPAP